MLQFLGGATRQDLLLFETLWNMPESRPFLSALIAVLSVYGTYSTSKYNFGTLLKVNFLSKTEESCGK